MMSEKINMEKGSCSQFKGLDKVQKTGVMSLCCILV
jgi:hypothetical protein